MTEHPDRAERRLHLQLMGRWELSSGGSPIELGGREQRLTALLALRGIRSRPYVAGTLWPDTSEDRALASLRAAVLRTRRRAPGVLQSGRMTVRLDESVSVDVHEVVHWTDLVEELPVDEAVKLVDRVGDGELLPGWYEDWVILERARFERIRLRALELVAHRALESGALGAALKAASEAMLIEPLLESVRAVTIRAHLLSGNRVEAVREFDAYRKQLELELGIEPSPDLVELVRPLILDPATHRRRRPSMAPTGATVPAPRSRAGLRASGDSPYR